MTDLLGEFVEGGLGLRMLLYIFRQRFKPDDDSPFPSYVGVASCRQCPLAIEEQPMRAVVTSAEGAARHRRVIHGGDTSLPGRRLRVQSPKKRRDNPSSFH